MIMERIIEWKTIPGYEGYYECSTHGRIRSLNYRNRGLVSFMSFMKGKNGSSVGLSKNGRTTILNVGVIIATCFKNYDSDRNIIIYIDGDKTNTDTSNLKIV